MKSSESGKPEMSVTSGDEERVDGQSNNGEREFPQAFYDPTTGRIMTDPVVNPSGDSYDKNNTLDSSVTFYPNRALRTIISRQIDMESSTSLRGSVRRISGSVRSSLSNIVSNPALGGGQKHRPLPDSFYCPISCDLMVDPFITPDGNSYERAAIVHWVSVNNVSPVTRNPLTVPDLRPNNALYELIQHEKSASAESRHPSIRRWQESGVDTSTRHSEAMSFSENDDPEAHQVSLTVSRTTARPVRGHYADGESSHSTLSAELTAPTNASPAVSSAACDDLFCSLVAIICCILIVAAIVMACSIVFCYVTC